MVAQDKASVIRRKTRAAREGGDPRVMSPVRALRLSLARAADTLFDLPLVVATVEQQRIEAGAIEAALGAEGLIVLLDGTGGARAALRLDPALLAGLIEVQTTGEVRRGPLRARPPTRTDAAMTAPLVDALLDGFDAEMTEGVAGHVPRGFRFGDRVEDARALTLLLTAPEFEMFRLTVDLGPGARSGALDLLLPVAPPPDRRAAAPRAAGAPSHGTGAQADAQADAQAGGQGAEDAQIATAALSAPAVLDAVLARLSLPLSAALGLRVGQRLTLPAETLGAAQLVGAGGHVVAEARLGRRDGWRALRLGPPQGGSAPGQAARPAPAAVPAKTPAPSPQPPDPASGEAPKEAPDAADPDPDSAAPGESALLPATG